MRKQGFLIVLVLILILAISPSVAGAQSQLISIYMVDFIEQPEGIFVMLGIESEAGTDVPRMYLTRLIKVEGGELVHAYWLQSNTCGPEEPRGNVVSCDDDNIWLIFSPGTESFRARITPVGHPEMSISADVDLP